MTKYIQQYKVFASVESLNRWLKKNVSYVENSGTMYNTGDIKVQNISSMPSNFVGNEDKKQTSVTPEYNFLVSYLKVDRDA